MTINFLAIDFETANSGRDSACAVGIAKVIDGRLVSSESYLIQPPDNEYDAWNIDIHGITPEMTVNAPAFIEVLDKIMGKYSDLPLVAHNASFDISVLRAGYESFGRPYPLREYYCTLILSKSVLPELPSHTLPKVHHACGGQAKEHHNPKDDAEACAEIFISIAQSLGASSFDDIVSKFGISPGRLTGDAYQPCRSRTRKADPKSITDFVINTDADVNGIFFNADVAFTGTMASMPRSQAMQIVADRGGRPKTSVSKFTEFIVVGDIDHNSFTKGKPSSKLKKAIELVDSGNSIQILSEHEFLKLAELFEEGQKVG
jgi:DNA polymerase-3 subunit epsilon